MRPITHFSPAAVDGINPLPLAPGSAVEVVLTAADGAQIRTFARAKGAKGGGGSSGGVGSGNLAFTLRGVPAPGAHVIAAYSPALVFPEVRLELDAAGAVARASYVFNGAPLPPAAALAMRPAGAAQYYEARRPLDVVGFVKTPYGLMIAFSVFVMVVMPMMKVDPEEYREAMGQLRGGTGGGGGNSGGADGGDGQQEASLSQPNPMLRLRR